MFTCRSKSSGNCRTWGQQWEYIPGKWLSIRHLCRFDNHSWIKHFSTHPFLSLTINITLSPTLPAPLSYPPPPSFPHPPIIPLCPSSSMDEWWYSRGIVEEESFPGLVASSSQIKQGTCSDHLSVGSVKKPSDTNSFFSSHALLVHTITSLYNAV